MNLKRTLAFLFGMCGMLLIVDMTALSSAHAEAVVNKVQHTVCQEQASATSLQAVTDCTVYADAAHTKALKYTQSVCTHKVLAHGSEVQTSCTSTVRYAGGQAQSSSTRNVSHSVSYQKLSSVLH